MSVIYIRNKDGVLTPISSGNNVDLDGYATEQWVMDQKYLTEVPEGYVKTDDISGKADKTGLRLGIHTDGLVYLFVDNAPVGTGINISAGGISGYVDSNNNIILNNLPNGTYTIKYEMDDGSVVEIGDLELDNSSEAAKGNLADPTSADWLTDKRLAMAYGYTKDSVGNIFTNYIPVKQGDILRVKGLNLYGVQNGVSSAIACYSSNTDTSTDSEGVLNAYKGGVYTAVTTELEVNGVRDQVIQDGNIFTYTILLYNDGTQMFDPETVYIRISAPLLEGYTAEDVIITIDEEITDTNVYYTVTNNLTNCTNSNDAVKVIGGKPYSAIISPNGGYEITSMTVTMGGESVSVSDGIIEIAEVKGDIVITAVAEVPKGNLADPTSEDWLTGYRWSLSEKSSKECASHIVTNYIPAKMGDTLRVKGLHIIGNTSDSEYTKMIRCDANKAQLGGSYGSKSTVSTDGYADNVTVVNDISTFTIFMHNNGTQKATSDTAYIRIDGFLMDGYTADDVIITVNEEIEIVNLIPKSTDASGNLYVGTNGEAGYKTSCRIRGTGEEHAYEGYSCTGFIPVTTGEKLYMYGMYADDISGNSRIALYKTDKTVVRSDIYPAKKGADGDYTDEGNGIYSYTIVDADVAFARISVKKIMDGSEIVTVNQPIV